MRQVLRKPLFDHPGFELEAAYVEYEIGKWQT
jgi:hypothetical protein